MRNPRILNFYILFFIFNLNLIIQITPSPFYESELKTNSNNSDSWGRIITPNDRIHNPTMRFKNENIYVAGKIDQMNWPYSYDTAIYLTKYDDTGVKLWEKIWDTPYEDELEGFELDSEENLYLLTITEPQYPNDDPERITLLKYSHSGELLWTKILITGRYCYGYAINLDLNDVIYISGGAWNVSVGYDFLLKLNSSGDILWNIHFNLQVRQLEIDLNNNVYFYGFIYPNSFMYKYNSSGSKLWSIDLGNRHFISSIKFDLNQNIILAGSKYYTNNDTNAMCISKYNNSGVFINEWEFSLLNYDWWDYGRTWINEDNFYVFIDYPFSPNSCLLKYNSTFHLDWNVSLSDYYVTPYYDLIMLAFDVDSQDNIFFFYNNPRGNYTSGISEEQYHTEDISVLKLNSSGEVLSQYFWGGSYHDEPTQIIIDPLNNIYLLCTSVYVDHWNIHRDQIVLVKNPGINGEPPQMGVTSLVSIIFLISIIRPKLKSIRKMTKNPL